MLSKILKKFDAFMTLIRKIKQNKLALLLLKERKKRYDFPIRVYLEVGPPRITLPRTVYTVRYVFDLILLQ